MSEQGDNPGLSYVPDKFHLVGKEPHIRPTAAKNCQASRASMEEKPRIPVLDRRDPQIQQRTSKNQIFGQKSHVSSTYFSKVTLHTETRFRTSYAPYYVSIRSQLSICISRGLLRLKNDIAPPVSGITGNCVLAVILGSVFFNLAEDTDSFFGRSALIISTTLLNAFVSVFEVSDASVLVGSQSSSGELMIR